MSIIWQDQNLPPGSKRWSKHESDRAQRLKDGGKTHREIGKILGRSSQSICLHLYERRMTPERLAEHRAMKLRSRNRTAKTIETARPLDLGIQTVNRPTAEMLADRDRRAVMPYRDLTSILCGDPPLGLSALDGRR